MKDTRISKNVATITLSKRPVGSRTAGKLLRHKILCLLNLPIIEHVVIDFADVNIISSGFADEAFAKLFLELQPVDFINQLGFKNCSSILASLIDDVIEKRVIQEN